jgi:hypothetical protein
MSHRTLSIVEIVHTLSIVDRVDATGVMVPGPYVARVVDLRTGLVCAYVFNAVAHKHILAEPNYVGKAFALAKLAPPPGKRYADMHVALLKPKAKAA